MYNYFENIKSAIPIKVDVMVKGKVSRVHVNLANGRAAYQLGSWLGYILGWIENINGLATFVPDPTCACYKYWKNFQRVNDSQTSLRNIDAVWSIYIAKLAVAKKAA
jgi:hypothetical protein